MARTIPDASTAARAAMKAADARQRELARRRAAVNARWNFGIRFAKGAGAFLLVVAASAGWWWPRNPALVRPADHTVDPRNQPAPQEQQQKTTPDSPLMLQLETQLRTRQP